MSDLIRRQAAIDTDGLDEEIRCEMCRNPMHTDRGCDGGCTYDEKLYKRIMQILDERIKPLPSAQPEKCTDKRTETHACDCISRQAAIDMLKNRWKKTRNYEGIGDDIAEECELYLKQVPSAQPERDDCDTCKHGFFGSVECNNCRVRYPSHWESREGGQDGKN